MKEDFVRCFDLAVRLDRSEVMVNMEGSTKVFESFSYKFCAIVRDDYLRNPRPVDNGMLDKLRSGTVYDGCNCFCFDPLREIVDSNEDKFLLGNNDR